MASTSVNKASNLARLDRISTLSHQAQGVLQVMMAANPDELPDDAIHNSGWVVLEMIREMSELALAKPA